MHPIHKYRFNIDIRAISITITKRVMKLWPTYSVTVHHIINGAVVWVVCTFINIITEYTISRVTVQTSTDVRSLSVHALIIISSTNVYHTILIQRNNVNSIAIQYKYKYNIWCKISYFVFYSKLNVFIMIFFQQKNQFLLNMKLTQLERKIKKNTGRHSLDACIHSLSFLHPPLSVLPLPW